MIWLAVTSLATSWLLQQFNIQFLLAIPALAWGAAVLGAWCLVGARAAALVFISAWTLCRAGWLIDSRLPESLASQDFMVRGVICAFPRADPEATRLVLEVDAGREFAPLPARLHLSWYDTAPALQPGERWQLLVRLKPPRGFANPAGFDFERWLYERGIGATGYVRASPLNQRLPVSMTACPVGAARSRIAQRIEQAVGGHPAAGYVLGVAVGATHRLTESDWDLLRRTGTTHLLAISGMNIAMVAAPFLLLGPLLGRLLPGRAGMPHAGIVPALMAAAAYSALSGFAVSTVRALVMLGIAAALAVRRRAVEGVDLLGAAALVVLVLDPTAVISVSFWLSFAAVGWLLVATLRPPRIQVPGAAGPSGKPSWVSAGRRFVVALLWTQLVLGLGLAPLTIAWFQQISVIAPLANLVAVPVFTLAVMPLTLLGTALIFPAPAAGGVLLRAAADVVNWLVAVLRLATDLPASIWQAPTVSATALILAAGAATIICWWRPVPLRSLAVFCLLPLLTGTAQPVSRLRVTVMDVGQGLSVLVRTPHHALLYDAGPAYRLRDAGESVVVPVLRQSGLTRLDVLMISHDDQDHVGGAATVLHEFTHARLIANRRFGLPAESFQRCTRGIAWNWDGVSFQVISPDAAPGRWSANDGSCVLRIEAGGMAVLLPGDIERRREDDLARRGLLEPANLVLAPHHGSRSSSGPAFIAATRPDYVVFPVGYLNRWRFPAAEIRKRWQESGACLLDTANDGAVVFEISPQGELQLRRRERFDGAHLWTAGGNAVPSCVQTGGE